MSEVDFHGPNKRKTNEEEGLTSSDPRKKRKEVRRRAAVLGSRFLRSDSLDTRDDSNMILDRSYASICFPLHLTYKSKIAFLLFRRGDVAAGGVRLGNDRGGGEEVVGAVTRGAVRVCGKLLRIKL